MVKILKFELFPLLNNPALFLSQFLSYVESREALMGFFFKIYFSRNPGFSAFNLLDVSSFLLTCCVASGIAVSMVMKYADNIVKVNS